MKIATSSSSIRRSRSRQGIVAANAVWGHPVDAAGKYTSLITLATVNERQLQASDTFVRVKKRMLRELQKVHVKAN